MFNYWKLKRKYNTLEINYRILKQDSSYKDRQITRLKNENKKIKEELKNANSRKRNKKG